jgi:glycosyltransferase involved in cell wall biosynthesis
MRVLHVTNLVSPHQIPLARQLASIVGERYFRFVATLPMTAEMGQRGWKNDEVEPWILRASENEAHRVEFEQWWNEADVVITGYRNVAMFADRVRRGKLTFYTSERWWKPPLGMARLLNPNFALMVARFQRLAKSPFFHFLPMGGYSAADMRQIAPFKGRMWDWGYFTTVPNPLPPCLERDRTLRILWAGRMLAWKRVDTLIRGFVLLLRQNPNARLMLIGDGPCRVKLERLTRKLKIAGSVEFQAGMQTIQVRNHMRNVHIYVLPSSAYEGWGAVLNEAMSEGCAIIASEAAGSAKTIRRHGENGLLFKDSDYRQLGDLLIRLNSDEPLRLRLAKAGQKIITECWSPVVAAKRFFAVSDALLSNRSVPCYPNGPMALLD